MALLSNINIEKYLDKEIVIHPYNPNSLTPIGYDFTIGDFVNSLEKGVLIPRNGIYEIPPKNTIQILTKESLWVSGKIGGTFHSKVSLVSKGFSHISTTLDPGWFGPLLITFRNNTEKIIEISQDETFVTLLFYKVLNKTKLKHDKPPYRKDILQKQLENSTEKYLKKVSELLLDDKTYYEFEQKVNEANKPMIIKISNTNKLRLKYIFINILHHSYFVIPIILIGLLGFYWERISNTYFQNEDYDTKIIAVQMTIIATFLIAYFNFLIKNKKS